MACSEGREGRGAAQGLWDPDLLMIVSGIDKRKVLNVTFAKICADVVMHLHAQRCELAIALGPVTRLGHAGQVSQRCAVTVSKEL